MDRKYLEDLDIGGGAKLSKETVDAIMGEHDKDVQAVTAERDSLRGQLTTVQDSLKKFDGVDVDKLNGQIKQLQNDLTAKDNEYKAKLADMTFDSALKDAITAAGGRNAKAVVALLDVEKLKASKNQKSDIDDALKALKTSDPYLFGGEAVGRVDSGSSHNDDNNMTPGGDAALRAAFGLPDKTKE